MPCRRPLFRGALWPHSPNNRSDAPSCAQNCAGFLWRIFHGIPRLHCCSFTPPCNGRQMGYGRKGMAPTTRAMTVGQGARFPYVVFLARAPHGAGRAGTARCKCRTRRFPCFFYRRTPSSPPTLSRPAFCSSNDAQCWSTRRALRLLRCRPGANDTPKFHRGAPRLWGKRGGGGVG